MYNIIQSIKTFYAPRERYSFIYILNEKKTYVKYELSNILVLLFFLIFTFSFGKDGYYLYIITFFFSFFFTYLLKSFYGN